MRPLYFDEARPDLPYTYLLTTGGGVLHGDRHRTDLTFGPGTSAHVTTQAHTKLYRMDEGYATALVNVDVGPGAHVEIVPDPVIPYAGSRYFQRTRVTLDPTATLVYGETLYAGRLSAASATSTTCTPPTSTSSGPTARRSSSTACASRRTVAAGWPSSTTATSWRRCT